MAGEEPGEPRNDPAPASEVDQAGDGGQLHGRVGLVDLPGVEVEDGALPSAERLLDGPRDPGLPREPGGPASAHHRRLPEEGADERGDLQQVARRGRNHRRSKGISDVSDRRDGKERRIDPEALLDERSEVRAGRRPERPLGGAEGRDGRSRGVLERRAGRAQVVPELFDALLGRAAVQVSMATDLVPRAGDPPDQPRVPSRHPAEDEEGRPRGALLEQGEDPLRGRDDAGRERVPSLRAVVRRVATDVEPLFDVDGQDEPGCGHGGGLWIMGAKRIRRRRSRSSCSGPRARK